ncbi:MAG: AMP-binding protein [Flavobacterium sp.]
MTPSYQSVHNKFKLNGFHLSKEDLCRVAYSFIKEGEEYEKPVGDFLLDWFDERTFVEMQTSGTTGLPKIIKVNKEAFVKSALLTGVYFDLKPGDKILQFLPVKYVAGKMLFIRSFLLGLDVKFVEPSAYPMQLIDENEQFEFAAMVPLQAKNSLDKLHQIKKVIIGGAKVNKPLANQLKKINSSIYETYGMTETISHIAAKLIKNKTFEVLPSIMISQNEDKCLVVNAPHITNELIVTNDIVELVSENQFIWKGRKDNIINSGGVKIFPEIVEEKLSGKIDRRYIISSKEDDTLGEKVILIVEGTPFTIDDSIFNELDKFEKPKAIEFIDQFQETATGKIIRRK